MRHLLTAASGLALMTGAAGAESFARIATFEIADQGREGESVAEIVAATADGMTLAYTDGAQGGIGLVDLSDPAAPAPAGFVETGGEPTSVVVAGAVALVGVNTSQSYVAPSGRVVAVDIAAATLAGEGCDLGGQPDALALSPDGTRLAVAIENERDEDLDDGVIPQMPAGFVVLMDVDAGMPDCASMVRADLTGLAGTAPTDPEPEFVAFDASGARVAVSLQENNHIAVLDAATGEVTSHFTAGTVSLTGVDATEDDRIDPSESIADIPREPDAIVWAGDLIATANEGDYLGGSRSFSLFTTDGEVVFDSASELEGIAIRAGHYPEGRSENKGTEPEGIAAGRFLGHDLVFVGLERASAIAVYELEGTGAVFGELFSPGGVGPEGILPLPERGLLVVASETDLREEGGVGSLLTVFEAQEDAAPAYPEVVSEAPIGWGALSGLAATDGGLVAVSDSFYSGAPAIYAMDVSGAPARITGKTLITEGGAVAPGLDPEGIAVTDGGYWIVSEGNPERAETPTDSQLIEVGADGAILRRIEMPDALKEGARRFGFEGVTVLGDTVWIAVQREWEGDAAGEVKLLSYAPATGEWGMVRYPLDAREADAGWVGLSEIVADGTGLLVLERDNRIGSAARIKRVYRVEMEGVSPAATLADAPLVEKVLARDILPDLAATHGPVQDKPEGMALGADGTLYVVTDNDGVDDASGETRLLRLSLD